MPMKLVISDVRDLPLAENDNCKIIYDSGTIHHCIGCFGCWIKTPGKCLIADGYEHMSERMSKCNELLLVSKCAYGGFSPFVKNVLDRAISYISPHFVTREGEMHHKRRYDNVIHITACFYGSSISEQEKQTAQNLVRANALNFDGEVDRVLFFDSADEARGMFE